MIVKKLIWFMLYSMGAPEKGIEKQENGINEERLGQLNQENICGSAPLAGRTGPAVHDKPWMALIMHAKPFDDGHQNCAGSLITNKYVLTSAGCIYKFKPGKPIGVRLGDHHIWEPEYCAGNTCERGHEDFGVEKTIVHKDYNKSNGFNDIALVKLSKYVEFKDHIRPICLPISDELFQKGISDNHFMVTSWGTFILFKPYGHLKYELSDQEKAVDISDKQIFSKSKCILKTGDPVTQANTQRKFAIQIGIVSQDNCDPKVLLISTNVAKYIPWITEKIVE